MPASVTFTYVASTDYYPAKACNWAGVAGKVLGTDGKPLLFQEILIGGTLDAKPVSFLKLSGSATLYGASGFEIVLGDHPVASTHTLWIQLLDNTTKPLTEKIFFDTYADCNQNLMMAVFTKNR